MIKNYSIFAILVFQMLLIIPGYVHAEEEKDTGWGLDTGGQKLYGDYLNTDMGVGAEAFIRHNLSKRIFMITALGYGSLHGNEEIGNKSFRTDMLTFDVRLSLNLSSDEIVKPYVTLGAGFFNFKTDQMASHKFDMSFIVGGGVEYMVSPEWSFSLMADYRPTGNDLLDGVEGGENDGYLNARVGFTHYFKSRSRKEKRYRERKNIEREIDKILASEEKTSQVKKRRFISVSDSLLKTNVGQYDKNFKIAYNYFNSYQYKIAAEMFEGLAKENMDSDYRFGYCSHWAGECYFGLKNYRIALSYFEKASVYHKSFRGASLYMIGRCHLKFKNEEKALEFFHQVVDECPDSPLVGKAQGYIKELEGEGATQINNDE